MNTVKISATITRPISFLSSTNPHDLQDIHRFKSALNNPLHRNQLVIFESIYLLKSH